MNKKKTPTASSPKRKTLEELCKKYGTPFSRDQQQSGTASIRFMTKPKSKEKEEE